MVGREDDHAPSRGTAPSAGDLGRLERMEPSEEARAREPSDVDAMGQGKRRKVVGHVSGPSRRSQIMFFASVAAVVVLVVGGWTLAVAIFDQPPNSYPDEAAWSGSDAEQVPTRDPSNPCGEPGNPHPTPQGSPCATDPNDRVPDSSAGS